jgi:hypothetical protein
LALLEKKPNLELKNRDGDTTLIRAVKLNGYDKIFDKNRDFR